jgi:hypothetical protein
MALQRTFAMTPTNDQDRSTDEALSLLRDAIAENKTALPASKRHPAESNDAEERLLSVDAMPMMQTVAVVETKRFDSLPAAKQSVNELGSQNRPSLESAQEPQGSLVSTTLSMVAVAISESTAFQAPQLLHSPVTQQAIVSKDATEEQAVSLIAEALSMVKSISAAEPVRDAVAPQSLQPPTRLPSEGPATPSRAALAEELTPEERLAMQRAEIRERVEMFKANQERFAREREEYYAATMAKVRTLLHPSP